MKSKKSRSLVLTAWDRSLLAGWRFFPLLLVIRRGTPLESVKHNVLPVMSRETETFDIQLRNICLISKNTNVYASNCTHFSIYDREPQLQVGQK